MTCWQCNRPVAANALVCPDCHALLHRDKLDQLSREAARLEPVNPRAAAEYWVECLRLLPPESKQYAMIAQRVEQLSSPQPLNYRAAEPAVAQAKNDSWQTALLKTGGSAALSIWFFHWLGGWWFAAGFVLLILIHEFGHVVANWHYGLKASPPIFLGPLGAVILLREMPKNARIEAVIGIAGPVFGTVAALGMYAFAMYSKNEIAMELAYWGFWLNLFNLIPLPPLDGGRATAAISPYVWVAGIAGLLGLALYRFSQERLHGVSVFLFIWILMEAWPRVKLTLRYLPQMKEYYNVATPFRIGMAVLHAGLAIGLYQMMKLSDPGG